MQPIIAVEAIEVDGNAGGFEDVCIIQDSPAAGGDENDQADAAQTDSGIPRQVSQHSLPVSAFEAFLGSGRELPVVKYSLPQTTELDIVEGDK